MSLNCPKINLEYFKYDDHKFICKFMDNINSKVKDVIGQTLYQALVLEMGDLIEFQYWRQNDFSFVCLKLMASKYLPNQLLDLLMEDVKTIYYQRKLGKTHLLYYDMILLDRKYPRPYIFS